MSAPALSPAVPPPAHSRRPSPPLEPTRDPRATLPDLIEVLLNRGVLLHLDLLISVADVPLIGISLKAAVAGVETMLEYGMMRGWDEQTRRWVQRSLGRDVAFADGETLLEQMAGGVLNRDVGTVWRPGVLYLTDRRLFILRREPRELLFEVSLDHVRAAGLESGARLRLALDGGAEAHLSAARPGDLLGLLEAQLERRGPRPGTTGMAGALPVPASGLTPALEGQLWYEEPRASGAVWRGGRAWLDAERGLVWRGALDARAAIVLPPPDVLAVRLEGRSTPVGPDVLAVAHARGRLRLSGPDVERWAEALRAVTRDRSGAGSAGGAHDRHDLRRSGGRTGE